MSATASSKFPLLDQWKEFADKHIVLEVIDNIISGFAQIALNDNTFAGLLMMAAAYVGSPVQAISGIWAGTIGTLTAHFLGVPRPLIRTGVYGFNPTLCGLAIPVLVFPDSPVTLQMLLYSALAAIFSIVLTVGIARILSNWDLPFLALPYCFTLLIFVPAALGLSNLDIGHHGPAVFEAAVSSGAVSWSFAEVTTAALNGIAQILWIDHPMTGVLYLIAVLMASRIDVFSSLLAGFLSAGVAIALGLPKELILTGIYGFNAVLLMKAMTRGFALNFKSYSVALMMSALTVIFSVALRVMFAPLGAIASFAFPFALLSLSAFVGRDLLSNMTYVPATEWGVPETINQQLKVQD